MHLCFPQPSTELDAGPIGQHHIQNHHVEARAHESPLGFGAGHDSLYPVRGELEVPNDELSGLEVIVDDENAHAASYHENAEQNPNRTGSRTRSLASLFEQKRM